MIFWKITKTCHELVVLVIFFLKKHYRQLFISPLRKKRSTSKSKIKLKEKLIDIPHWSNCFKVQKLMFLNTTAINVIICIYTYKIVILFFSIFRTLCSIFLPKKLNSINIFKVIKPHLLTRKVTQLWIQMRLVVVSSRQKSQKLRLVMDQVIPISVICWLS